MAGAIPQAPIHLKASGENKPSGVVSPAFIFNISLNLSIIVWLPLT